MSRPDQPDHGEPFGVTGQAREHHADDRDDRDQQAGRGAGQAPLRVRQQQPGSDDLDEREHHQPPPVRQQDPDLPGAAGRAGSSRTAATEVRGEHEHGDRDALVGHLDEQVGNPPDHAHRREQDPAPPTHVTSPLPGPATSGPTPADRLVFRAAAAREYPRGQFPERAQGESAAKVDVTCAGNRSSSRRPAARCSPGARPAAAPAARTSGTPAAAMPTAAGRTRWRATAGRASGGPPGRRERRPGGPAACACAGRCWSALAGGLALTAAFPPAGSGRWPRSARRCWWWRCGSGACADRSRSGCCSAWRFFVPLLSWLINLAWYAWAALAVAEARHLRGARRWASGCCCGCAPGRWPWRAGGSRPRRLRDRWPWGGFPWGRLAMSQAQAPDRAAGPPSAGRRC